jgi:hypothetical protein
MRKTDQIIVESRDSNVKELYTGEFEGGRTKITEARRPSRLLDHPAPRHCIQRTHPSLLPPECRREAFCVTREPLPLEYIDAHGD